MEENVKKQCLFGMHPVLEAIRAGKKIEKVLLKKGMDGPQFRELLELLEKGRIPYQFVPLEKLDRTVRGVHQGVVAYIPDIEYVSLEDLVETALASDTAPLLVLLDGVSDVRNLGAIARTLECAGGNGIIVPAKGGAAINADAIKVSAGALMRIGTCRVPNLKIAAYYLRQSGFRIVAATEKSDRRIYDADMTGDSDGRGDIITECLGCRIRSAVRGCKTETVDKQIIRQENEKVASDNICSRHGCHCKRPEEGRCGAFVFVF